MVLLGGHPGEWEGEHPLDAIERTGAENVFLAGWHEHAPLPDFFNASDVLVHSSANEQFGQVLIEAMASGLPVIAVERGGPAHIVDHGETGWLIEPDDREALEQAMVEAVNEPERRQRMGVAARTEAIDSYGWPKIGAELAELVVNEAGRGRARGRGDSCCRSPDQSEASASARAERAGERTGRPRAAALRSGGRGGRRREGRRRARP